jgi:hypothetical protein
VNDGPLRRNFVCTPGDPWQNGGMVAMLTLFATLSGTWVFEVQTDQGSGTPTFVLKQEGERLTGRYSGQLGEADVTGAVKGEKFTLEFMLEMGGQSGKVVYTGEVLKDGTVKGRVSLFGMAEGTFTGRRKGD